MTCRGEEFQCYRDRLARGVVSNQPLAMSFDGTPILGVVVTVFSILPRPPFLNMIFCRPMLCFGAAAPLFQSFTADNPTMLVFHIILSLWVFGFRAEFCIFALQRNCATCYQ